MSLSDIAMELHCTTSNVTNMIKAQLAVEAAAVPDEERAGILALENARLDYYLSKLWPSIEYGDVKSIAQALKISEMRLKANRLDEPVSDNRTQVLVIGGESQSYVEKLKELTGD